MYIYIYICIFKVQDAANGFWRDESETHRHQNGKQKTHVCNVGTIYTYTLQPHSNYQYGLLLSVSWLLFVITIIFMTIDFRYVFLFFLKKPLCCFSNHTHTHTLRLLCFFILSRSLCTGDSRDAGQWFLRDLWACLEECRAHGWGKGSLIIHCGEGWHVHVALYSYRYCDCQKYNLHHMPSMYGIFTYIYHRNQPCM